MIILKIPYHEINDDFWGLRGGVGVVGLVGGGGVIVRVLFIILIIR